MSQIIRKTFQTIALTAWALTPLDAVFPVGFGISTAAAQTEAEGTSLHLMPPGDVIGDGETPVTLRFAGLNANGTPAPGITARSVNFSDGSSGRLVESGDGNGLYHIEWVPEEVEESTQTELRLRVRVPGQSSTEQTWSLRVIPPLGEDVVVTSNPERIILGQDESATLDIRLSHGERSTARDSNIRILTSAGTVSNLTALGNGRFTALFTPPTDDNPLPPHVAIITVADARNPSATYGSLELPLVGRINFPVTSEPNSTLLIEIGDRTFGPIQSNASGQAQIPIIVPPGNLDSRVITINDSGRTERPLDLMVPPSQRVQLFPLHQSIPADPNTRVQIRAMVITPNGEPDNSARVEFAVTAGEVSEARLLGDGVYAAMFTPAQGNRSSQATVTVRLLGSGEGNQADAITLDLVPIRPSHLNISSNPPILGESTRDFRLNSRLSGPDGIGIAGREIDFRVAGARINGTTRDTGGGDYVTNFSTTGNGPVEIVATVRAPASGNPLRQILVFPARQRLTNDGRESTMVTILTLDEFGYPVTGVPVALGVSRGDGTLPATVSTDGSGIAQVRFTAGRNQGISHISASSGGLTGSAGILQLSENAIFDPEIGFSGSAELIELRDNWSALVTPHRIEREGMMGVMPGEEEDATSTGPISRLNLSADPEVAGPGGTITLSVNAVDSAGRGTSGRELTFMVRPSGTFGNVSDLGGGNYEITLQLEEDVNEDVQISVQADGTNVSAFVTVPITGATPEVTETVTETVVEEEVSEPTPRVRSFTLADAPSLRLSVHYDGGLYSYRQEPKTSNGPMYNKVITVGGGITPPAGTAGVLIGASAAVPNVDWLNVDAHFRASYWSMEIGEGFDAPVSDALHDIGLRLRAERTIELDGARLRPGVSTGLALNDFIVYKLTQEDGVAFIEHDQLLISSFRAGANLGIDIADIRIDGGLSMDVNTSSIGDCWGGQLGAFYAMNDTWGVSAHTQHLRREIDVYSTLASGDKTRVGEMRDGHTSFGVGLTWTP